MMRTSIAAVTALAAVALVAGAGAARAGCATKGKLQAGAGHTMPNFIVRNLKPATPGGIANAKQYIVGSWLVTYTAGGAPGGQALIQWHDDGTEWENINFPIEGGNICLGSWKSVDARNVTRLHIGWLYTAGQLSGYFTETETDHLDSLDSYSGTNDTKIYDLGGNVQVEFPGTSSAVRIAP